MLGPERRANLALDLPAAKAATAMLRPLDRANDQDVEQAQPLDVVGASDEKSAAKEALAANLEGMIEGMLRTTQFATAAGTKARGWAQQIGEVAALDASTDDTGFSASSLIADLAQARGVVETAVVRPAAPRRWWIDAVLVLACLLSVASAGYLTFGT